MKCYQHIDNDAVAQCCDCGKGLCSACTDKWSMPICDACNYLRAGNEKKQVVKNLMLTIPLLMVGFLIVPSQADFGTKFMLGYLCAGIPWGWSVLNRITPNIFLFLPIGGWILYFTIKFLIAYFIGIVALPYKLYKFIKIYKEAQKIQGIIDGKIEV
ncbi:MAG: hypothetical protein ACRC76_07665 [Proteocatella sp.]